MTQNQKFFIDFLKMNNAYKAYKDNVYRCFTNNPSFYCFGARHGHKPKIFAFFWIIISTRHFLRFERIIFDSFVWDHTPQGYKFWHNLHCKFNDVLSLRMNKLIENLSARGLEESNVNYLMEWPEPRTPLPKEITEVAASVDKKILKHTKPPHRHTRWTSGLTNTPTHGLPF